MTHRSNHNQNNDVAAHLSWLRGERSGTEMRVVAAGGGKRATEGNGFRTVRFRFDVAFVLSDAPQDLGVNAICLSLPNSLLPRSFDIDDLLDIRLRRSFPTLIDQRNR